MPRPLARDRAPLTNVICRTAPPLAHCRECVQVDTYISLVYGRQIFSGLCFGLHDRLAFGTHAKEEVSDAVLASAQTIPFRNSFSGYFVPRHTIPSFRSVTNIERSNV